MRTGLLKGSSPLPHEYLSQESILELYFLKLYFIKQVMMYTQKEKYLPTYCWEKLERLQDLKTSHCQLINQELNIYLIKSVPLK